jgi:hypothetical protein
MLIGAARAAAPAGPVVVELFTSQGCNSCPPADALLGELKARPDVLALALHVTYWDDLGWHDVFSQDQFDQRQRRYVQQTGRGSVYTPQMVVNGTQDVVGSQRQAVMRTLDKAARPASISVQSHDGQLAISLPALQQPCDCVLTLFGVQPSARTAVGRGENKGRSLEEFQIVRIMQSLGGWRGEARMLQVTPAKMPAEVSAYALLAQERVSGRVVAAGR